MTKARTQSVPNVVIDFEFEKPTKNKVRYQEKVEPGSTPRVGVLYLDKAEHESLGEPASITVTITAK